jgi:multidrug efflux pump subunit AcrA (membrane-fusion protein)
MTTAVQDETQGRLPEPEPQDGTAPVEAAPAPAGPVDGPPTPAPLRRSPWRAVRTGLVVLALLGGAVAGGRYIVDQRLAEQAYVDLGSAVLTAEAIPVGSANAGVVTELKVADQDRVRAGQELARVRLTANGGNERGPVEVLRAPVAGLVSATNIELGGVARAGEPVVTLYDPSKLTFHAQVWAEDLRKLRLGMTAYVTGPGIDDRITATLDRVQPQVVTDPPMEADRMTVVLVPRAADTATVSTLVPGLPFQATVDTRTAAGTTPAVNTA